MATWAFAAPYDAAPKTRYMNPAVHPELFVRALADWENSHNSLPPELCIWVLILHPDDVWPQRGPDQLYACSIEAVAKNLAGFAAVLARTGEVEWTTLTAGARRWMAAATAA